MAFFVASIAYVHCPSVPQPVPKICPQQCGTLLVANGTLSAPVEATYALADYRDAIANAARNERNGKVLFALQ